VAGWWSKRSSDPTTQPLHPTTTQYNAPRRRGGRQMAPNGWGGNLPRFGGGAKERVI